MDPSPTSRDPLQRVGSGRGSSMPVALLNTLIIPVQALAWLGRQGTRAIAALVFIGIVVPPIGNVLKPFVTEAIFLLLCISFMRVDISALHDHLRRPGIILAATGWTNLGVPLIFGFGCLATWLFFQCDKKATSANRLLAAHRSCAYCVCHARSILYPLSASSRRFI
jgi:hypothetical protein